LVPFEDEIRPRTPPSRHIIERNGRGCERTVHNKVTPSTPAPQKRSSQSTRELLNEVEDREQVLSGEVLTLQTRLSYAQRDLWQLQNIVSVGIYRTAPGRHSRACRTFPVLVITSVTVVVSYEARTRVTPLDITFIHSFSLEGRHKLQYDWITLTDRVACSCSKSQTT